MMSNFLKRIKNLAVRLFPLLFWPLLFIFAFFLGVNYGV